MALNQFDPGPYDRARIIVGSFLVIVWAVVLHWIAFGLFLSAAGCAPPQRVPVIAVVDTTKPIPVMVTRAAPATCPNLPEPEQMPAAPEVIRFDYDKQEIFDRSFVHLRDYNKLLEYIQLDAIWRVEFYRCIQHLTHPDIP